MNYTSVGLSRRIDAAGIKGPHEFAWHEGRNVYGEGNGSYYVANAASAIDGDIYLFPAYTASECWAMLPMHISGYELTVEKTRCGALAYYRDPFDVENCLLAATYDSPHLVGALGELLLWCDANGHLEVSK